MESGNLLGLLTVLAGLAATLLTFSTNRFKDGGQVASDLRDDLRDDREHFKAEAERYRDLAFKATEECHDKKLQVERLEGQLQKAQTVNEANAALLEEKDARIDAHAVQVQSLSDIVAQKSAGLSRLVAQLETVRSCPLAHPASERVCPMADAIAQFETHPETAPPEVS